MEEIGLQDLIYQVKDELLAANPAQQPKHPYPLFFVDKIELEIAVKVSRSRGGGIRLTVLEFAEASTSQSVDHERGHVVKVSLSPLLSRENILTQALKNESVRQIVLEESVQALMKGDEGMVGEPE
jgi:hypothetical protein